jgi:Phage stabilisation protein
MRIPFATSAHVRERGALAPARQVNMFAEKTPMTQDQVILQSRLGLVEDFTVGDGPIRASIAKDGVFDGDRLTVSGSVVYRGTNIIGTMAGDGPVYIACSDTEALFCAGSTLYSYDGSTFEAVTLPYAEGTAAVVHIDGLFVALRKGTGEWFFSAVLDGRTWDGTNFATAESEADQLLDVIAFLGGLVFFGTETVEFWIKTGDAELPYTPVTQRVFRQGIKATGCVVAEDNSFFWVGADNLFYRHDTVPKAVDDDALNEKIAASETCRVFKITDGRHKWICIRLDDYTHAYDVTTGESFELATQGRANFRAGPDMGDDETGTVWAFGGHLDDTAPLVRIFTAGTELQQAVTVNNLRLTCEVGTTEDLEGEFADPQIECRASRDYGRTWSAWIPTSLGVQGDYDLRVEWRALGMFRDPGVVFQFRVSAPVSFRVGAVAVNEGYGGR